MPNTAGIASQVFPYKLPAWLLWLLKNFELFLLILLLLLVLLAFITGAFLVLGILAVLAAVAYPFLSKLKADVVAAEAIADPQKQVDAIAQIPVRPNFTLTLSDETTNPGPTPTGTTTDSVEARNFRMALTGFTKRLAVVQPVREILPLNLANAYTKVSTAIHPHTSFPYRLSSLVQFPAYIKIDRPETIFPAMAYPDFEEPMYKPLSDISGELLLPNLKLIPNNTISLLKTNQKFIESYMVGLNHEMGRELLWREYPTDERGSYFRQFWDVKGIIKPKENKSEAELTEDYKDIKPIHTWPISSDLGRHNNRDAQGDAEQTVLVIRGDLLKRYPNTLIFAQKAIAGKSEEEPEIDLDLTTQEFEQQVKFPYTKLNCHPILNSLGLT